MACGDSRHDLNYPEIPNSWKNKEKTKRMGGEMKTTNWTIKGAFGIIGEIFDELSHADRAWNACGWGESVRETIDEAIRTYM